MAHTCHSENHHSLHQLCEQCEREFLRLCEDEEAATLAVRFREREPQEEPGSRPATLAEMNALQKTIDADFMAGLDLIAESHIEHGLTLTRNLAALARRISELENALAQHIAERDAPLASNWRVQ